MGAGNCVWNPDKLEIACITLTDEYPHKPELRFLDVNGNISRKILLPERISGSSWVQWSPDAEKLAISYYGSSKASTDIFFINTGELQPVASGYVFDWSPDSNWLLTWETGIDVPSPSDFSITNIDSGQIIPLSKGDGFQASWQP
jgi:hypothetical protein